MSLQHQMSCFCALTLLYSILFLPAQAQDVPARDAQEMPGGYSMPSLFPLYSGPPFQFRGNRLMVVRFKTAPEVLRELVPQPLLPNPDNLMFTEKDGEISGRVKRFGSVLISLSGKLQKRLEPGPDQPKKTWFVQKLIPSVRKDAPADVWQLVSSVNIDNLTKELWDCSAKLEFATGPQDPLGNIKILEIVSAQFSVGDFAMDYGEVLHDYLAKK